MILPVTPSFGPSARRWLATRASERNVLYVGKAEASEAAG